MEALDLIDSVPVTSETFIKAKLILEQNFGIDYPKEKFAILFDMIRDENWSEERFNRTLKWFLKTKYNQSWSVSDWFQYSIKLRTFSWVRMTCNKNGLREVDFIKTLDCYLIDGIRMYKEKDGIEMPFEICRY